MCKIILSINPEHIEKILNGTKQYEFRKVKCKESVDKIIIYATAPLKKVIAEATVVDIIEDDINEVWKMTKEFAGISYKFFRSYYIRKEKGYCV